METSMTSIENCQRLEQYEEWIKISIMIAQIHAYSGIQDDSWRDVDWTEYLPSGQYDIWQTLDEETKLRLTTIKEEK